MTRFLNSAKSASALLACLLLLANRADSNWASGLLDAALLVLLISITRKLKS
jgi:hypothetical protein